MVDASFRSLLASEYSERCLRNESYSIRAFARDLGLSKSSISAALSGQRGLSKASKEKVLDKLCLSPKERSRYSDKKSIAYHDVDEDIFRTISDWYCLAILCLLKTEDAILDSAWISSRLGITKTEADLGVERLTRLGLIEVDEEGFECMEKPLKTSEDIASAAQKQHHSQNLVRAEKSLHRDPIEDREMTSIMVPMDPAILPEIKSDIRKFRTKMLKKLESSQSKEVYTLAIQLFPQTIKENQK